VELRAADLRFAADEARTYLADVMGLSLPPESVTALAERTEGWAAALQLAGLSLQGRGDSADAVAAFAGDDRFVVDYLVDEVLPTLRPDITIDVAGSNPRPAVAPTSRQATAGATVSELPTGVAAAS